MRPRIDLAGQISAARRSPAITTGGTVRRVIGLTIEVTGLSGRIGELCHVYPVAGEPGIEAEIVGFRDQVVLLMPFGELHGIQPGSVVEGSGDVLQVPVGEGMLGRVLDGLGRAIDGRGPLAAQEQRLIHAEPPSPLRRQRIMKRLSTGVRAVDALLTVGKGQRMGIFSGSGVGKSTLLGMIARSSTADVNVIALIGERGREVRDFIERDLGEEGMACSVVVVSTSDQAALNRIRGAYVATTIAEYFRDRGRDVVLFMDSVTRFAMAQREIGLASGEPPASKGYTPSVFALLPKLMERAGNSDVGSITGFYTVLVEGDDLTEPVTDTARSVLDGHITLSRELAGRQHYPAIDFMDSISRAMPDVAKSEHQDAAARFRATYATYEAASDLIDIGAYQAGSNPRIDQAIRLRQPMLAFLRQPMTDFVDFSTTLEELYALFPARGAGQSDVVDTTEAMPAAGPVLDPLQAQYFRPEMTAAPVENAPAENLLMPEAPSAAGETADDLLDDLLEQATPTAAGETADDLLDDLLEQATPTAAGETADELLDDLLEQAIPTAAGETADELLERDAPLAEELPDDRIVDEEPAAIKSTHGEPAIERAVAGDILEPESDPDSLDARAQPWSPELLDPLDDDEFLSMIPAGGDDDPAPDPGGEDAPRPLDDEDEV